MADYRGFEDKPELKWFHHTEGRGTTFAYDIHGQDLQVYVTSKAKKVRVFLNHEELK